VVFTSAIVLDVTLFRKRCNGPWGCIHLKFFVGFFGNKSRLGAAFVYQFGVNRHKGGG
jgi:hypothetical protein